MSKVALTMIVKGSESKETLQRCLDSVQPFVDGCYLTVTTKDENGLVDYLKERGVTVDYKPDKFFGEITQEDIEWFEKYAEFKPVATAGDRVFLFDEARNHSLGQIPDDYSWFIWMDVDDVLRGGENLKQVIADNEATNCESTFFNYIYHPEIKDNKIVGVIIEHLRERLCKTGGLYKWVAPIHETLIEQRPTSKNKTDKCDILHLSYEDRRMDALYRNVKTLEFLVATTKGADPRPVYYLGKVYFDIARHENKPEFFKYAAKLFNNYIFGTKEYNNNNRSGWAEERSQCWEYLMEIQREFENHDKSIECGMYALMEDEKFPSIYLNIALSYLIKGFFEKAIFWVNLAAKVPQPESTLVNNPKDQQSRALEILYNAHLQLSHLDEAYTCAKKLYELIPESQLMEERLKFMTALKMQRDLTKATVQIADHISKHGQPAQLKALMMAIPHEIKNNPIMVDLAKKVIPPKVWDKDEVAIFCGPGFTQWSPKSLEKAGGFVGGSEEAVIYLSQALVKQGWKVTVYADPGADEGEYDGVTFLPYYAFNNLDTFNIVVAWRRPEFADQDIKCKGLFIWCHDQQNPLHYTEERLKKITKVIVLSPWHRGNIKNVPDDKILISGNGVVL